MLNEYDLNRFREFHSVGTDLSAYETLPFLVISFDEGHFSRRTMLNVLTPRKGF